MFKCSLSRNHDNFKHVPSLYAIPDWIPSLVSLQYQNEVTQYSVSKDCRKHEPNPLANLAIRPGVLVCLKYGSATDLATRLKVRRIHALVLPGNLGLGAIPNGGSELVHHHTLEDIGLIIYVVEDIWQARMISYAFVVSRDPC